MVRYQEAHDQIQLQDQSKLPYRALLNHCQLLESWYKQYQNARIPFQLPLPQHLQSTRMPSNPPSVLNMAILTPTTSAWPMSRSVSTVVAKTTTQYFAEAPREHNDHPMTPEWSHPGPKVNTPKQQDPFQVPQI